jgi:hypothetical protein
MAVVYTSLCKMFKIEHPFHKQKNKPQFYFFIRFALPQGRTEGRAKGTPSMGQSPKPKGAPPQWVLSAGAEAPPKEAPPAQNPQNPKGPRTPKPQAPLGFKSGEEPDRGRADPKRPDPGLWFWFRGVVIKHQKKSLLVSLALELSRFALCGAGAKRHFGGG